ncbi:MULTISPECIES: DoxX family protein [Corynebacterium]|uniref:DoxX family protein n=1 Tax=Corynebacterium TaxID=1716 RepID=UPI00124D9EC8|nr:MULTISPECIES: DoxX family protein [Corynebacterium]
MIRKIARPMVATVYIADGVDTITNTEKHVEGTKTILDRLRSVLPNDYSRKLPEDPETVAKAIGVTKTTAGTLLALGKAPRLAAGTLAVLSVPTILARHAFWETQNEDEKAARRSGFMTDVALLGGLFIASADTAGKPGLKWRANRAAKDANKTIQSALPGKSDTEKFKENVAEQASAVNSATKDFLSSTSEKVSGYADEAKSYVDDNKDDWLNLAKSNTKTAKKKLVKAADQAQKRAEKARKDASKNAPKLQKRADKALRKAQKSLDKKVKDFA